MKVALISLTANVGVHVQRYRDVVFELLERSNLFLKYRPTGIGVEPFRCWNAALRILRFNCGKVGKKSRVFCDAGQLSGVESAEISCSIFSINCTAPKVQRSLFLCACVYAFVCVLEFVKESGRQGNRSLVSAS